MYKKMLVPLDGSKLAETALPFATELSWKLNLETILFHVCAPEERELAPMHQAYIHRTVEAMMQRLEGIQEQADTPTIEARGELATGHPADEILRYAEKNNVDLILMATHGRSGPSRWIYGSVTEKVLQGASSPLLLVRPSASSSEQG